MTKTTDSIRVELLPGAVRSFRIGRGQTLTVESAAGRSVWMTRNGERYDYWLAAGERIALCRGDAITVSVDKSDGAARIALMPDGTARAGIRWLRAATALAAAVRMRLPFAGARAGAAACASH